MDMLSKWLQGEEALEQESPLQEAVAEEELAPTVNLLIALIRAAERHDLSEFR